MTRGGACPRPTRPPWSNGDLLAQLWIGHALFRMTDAQTEHRPGRKPALWPTCLSTVSTAHGHMGVGDVNTSAVASRHKLPSPR